MGVLITMKNKFPIEKSLPFFLNFNEKSDHFIFFGLQGNAGSSGAEGKPVSLGLVQKVCLCLLTFFYYF